jgi:hypothetical protein
MVEIYLKKIYYQCIIIFFIRNRDAERTNVVVEKDK